MRWISSVMDSDEPEVHNRWPVSEHGFGLEHAHQLGTSYQGYDSAFPPSMTTNYSFDERKHIYYPEDYRSSQGPEYMPSYEMSMSDIPPYSASYHGREYDDVFLGSMSRSPMMSPATASVLPDDFQMVAPDFLDQQNEFLAGMHI